MAKNNSNSNEKNAKTPVVSTVENIYETLDKAVVANDESLPAQVKEQLKKESDENTIKQMKSRYQKAQYTIDNGLLKKRKQKELDKISTAELTMVDRIARFMMGFEVTEEVISHAKHCPDTLFSIEKINEKDKTVSITVDGKETVYKVGDNVPACIDYVDYDDYLEKIKKEIRNKCREAEEQYDKYSKKLQAKYNQYWDRSWWY